jgi:hypothetical protein
MSEELDLLQAEIRQDLDAIRAAYAALNSLSGRPLDEETSILTSYYLHVVYGLFENLFTRIAASFGNRFDDTAQWHTQLLQRMTLDIPGLRPPVVSRQLYTNLDELRRFRHLFRNAYLLRFDPDRLALVIRDAQRVEALYESELERFLHFLDQLAPS